MAYRIRNKDYDRKYALWHGMLDRCNKATHKQYPDYGGRGIKVCKRWHDRKLFWDDMGPSYEEGLTLDRVNNNKGYSLKNCRWATRKEQALNRRSNRHITHKGQTKTINQWAEYLGIKRTTLSMRLDEYGWSISEAFNPEKRVRN